MGILVENVSKSYNGRTFLQDVTLEVQDGDFVTCLGPTGSGKTTLLRIMAGVDRPDRGRIYYDGVDVAHTPVRKRSVAMVYQEFVNYPSLTIFENIASPLRVSRKRIAESEIERQVKESAELLGVADVLSHYPEEVSGGQKQRTAIARALIKGAKYVFLDEPMANLDFKLREELRGELKRVFRDKGSCIVYATADPIDALSMGTHVASLHGGKLLQYGPVEEVYRNPKFVEVGVYFSYPTMNIFESEMLREGDRWFLAASDQLKVDVTSLRESLNDKSYLLGIRAHSLSLGRMTDRAISVKATVELAEVVGSDTELHVIHDGIRLVILAQALLSHRIGEEIDVYLDPHQFFIFEKRTKSLIAKTAID